MSDPQGMFEFPGIPAMFSGVYSIAHGISPSIAVLEVPPEHNFLVQIGPLAITYGSKVKIVLPDCKLDLASYRSDDGGQTWTIRCMDRRWRWQYPTISGVYNQRTPDGEFDAFPTLPPKDLNAAILKAKGDKTPQELAKLLLDAMDETNYDVSQLPNHTRPAVNWDHSNAAEELARLCDSLGCRVVLGTDNRVHLCLLGSGQSLPSNQVESGGFSFDPPDMPDALLAVCGPTAYQIRLHLEAVGLDLDGIIKPLKDLSYNPAGDNHVQRVTISGATSGTFSLSFQGDSTIDLPYNASATAVQSALESLSGIGSGNVSVSGAYDITFKGSLKNQTVSLMGLDTSSLGGSSITGSVTTTTPGRSGQGEPYGWVGQDPETLTALLGDDSFSERTHALALSCVYRMYRVVAPATTNISLSPPNWIMAIPHYGKITSVKQLLPLQNQLLDVEDFGVPAPPVIGRELPQPAAAFVSGVFYRTEPDPKTFVNTPEGTRYKGSFTLDGDRGLVIFSEPAYTLVKMTQDLQTTATPPRTIVSSGSFAAFPAKLILECTCNVRDPDKRTPERYTVLRHLTSGIYKTKPKEIRRDDERLEVRARYQSRAVVARSINDTLTFAQAIASPTPEVLINTITNLPSTGLNNASVGLDDRLRYYLDAEQAMFQPKQSLSYSYAGIVDLSPDGRIHQITWRVGPDGSTTEASENSEFDLAVPSYGERRAAEIARQQRIEATSGKKGGK